MSEFVDAMPHGTTVGMMVNGRYRINSVLGHGATGIVLLATDTQLDMSEVALKVLYPHLLTDDRALTRFRTETSITFELAHPNIVQTFSFELWPDQGYFISMEYLPHGSLHESLGRISGSRFNLSDWLGRINMISNGLLYAHRRGIVHRDIKPQNILLAEPIDSIHPAKLKIADFGLSHMRWQETSTTRVGDIIGTPYYMSPEQLESLPLDCRSDIYSFGITAYELVTGTVPFQAASLFELAMQHCTRPLPSVSESITDSPPWLDEFLARCTAKDPTDRFQSMEEIATYLRRYQEHCWVDVTSEEQGSRLDERHQVQQLSAELRRNLRFITSVMLAVGLFISVNLVSRFHMPVQRRVAVGLLHLERTFGIDLAWLRAATGVQVAWDPKTNVDILFDRRKSRSHIFPLLQAGLNPNVSRQVDGILQTPLHVWAKTISDTQARVTRFLLEAGADINAKDSNGQTPIIGAASIGHLQSVKLLLSHRADVDAHNDLGRTALHYAVENGYLEVTKALVEAGADSHQSDHQGKRPQDLIDTVQTTEVRKRLFLDALKSTSKS